MGGGGTVPPIPYAEVDEYECSTWQPRGYVPENVPVPTERQAGWAPEMSWAFWRNENLFEVPGIKLRFTGHPVCHSLGVKVWKAVQSSYTNNIHALYVLVLINFWRSVNNWKRLMAYG